jgi:hypothetical protein
MLIGAGAGRLPLKMLNGFHLVIRARSWCGADNTGWLGLRR